MSAEELRRAADLLRGRATAATPGPWVAAEGASGGWWVELPNLADVALDLHGANACHIATLHPGVGLALAAWLDDVAAGWVWGDDAEVMDSDDYVLTLEESMDRHPLDLARLILAEATR